jgi:hypothetical protein
MLAGLTWHEQLQVLQGVLIFSSPIVTYLTLRWAWSFYIAERWRRQTKTQQRGFEVIENERA